VTFPIADTGGFSDLAPSHLQGVHRPSAVQASEIRDDRRHVLPCLDGCEKPTASDINASHNITGSRHTATPPIRSPMLLSVASCGARFRRRMFFDVNRASLLVIPLRNDLTVASPVHGLSLHATCSLRRVIERFSDVAFGIWESVFGFVRCLLRSILDFYLAAWTA